MSTNNTLHCNRCGANISNASRVIYLDGNLPICDLCFEKMKMQILYDMIDTGGTIEKLEGGINEKNSGKC